jgi:hypothetical protein
LIWKGKDSSTKAQSKDTQGISLSPNQSFPSRIADLISQGKENRTSAQYQQLTFQICYHVLVTRFIVLLFL